MEKQKEENKKCAKCLKCKNPCRENSMFCTPCYTKAMSKVGATPSTTANVGYVNLTREEVQQRLAKEGVDMELLDKAEKEFDKMVKGSSDMVKCSICDKLEKEDHVFICLSCSEILVNTPQTKPLKAQREGLQPDDVSVMATAQLDKTGETTLSDESYEEATCPVCRLKYKTNRYYPEDKVKETIKEIKEQYILFRRGHLEENFFDMVIDRIVGDNLK